MKTVSGKSQSGFSMVEVLVAVIILAVGLLGVAGVQLASLQQITTANQRTQATLFTQDLAEKLRLSADGELTTAELNAVKAQMRAVMGSAADVTISKEDDIATITVSWSERKTSEETSDGSTSAVSKFDMEVRL